MPGVEVLRDGRQRHVHDRHVDRADEHRPAQHSEATVATTHGLYPPIFLVAELNLVLMGPPGAGKGTQAERLVDDFDLPYYATGDILRAAVEEESDLGKEAKGYMDEGDLVPDELICRVIMERLDSGEAEDGFLLDGFPRTVGQADTLAGGARRARPRAHRRAADRGGRTTRWSAASRAGASARRTATSTTSSSTRRRTPTSATRTAPG